VKSLTLYSREGCHLCEDFLETVLPMVRGQADIAVVDIDVDTRFRDAYHVRIPVLADGERVVCEGFVDRDAVLEWLSQACE
jgi:hypothetical protein